MKKLIYIVILAFVFGLSGCGKEDLIDITGNENLIFYIGSDLENISEDVQISGLHSEGATIEVDTSLVNEYVTGMYNVTFFVIEDEIKIYSETVQIEITDTPLTDQPEITFARDVIYITTYEEPDYLDGILGIDKVDGDITEDIVVDSTSVDLETPGTYIVSYSLQNELGLVSTKQVKVYVIENIEFGSLPDEFLIVKRFGYKGIVDLDNNIVVPIDYDEVSYLGCSVIKIEMDDVFFYYNFDTSEYFTSKHNILKYSNDISVATNLFSSYGYVDISGNELIEFEYDYAYPFHNGTALVVKNGLYGIIDTTGTSVIGLEHNALRKLSEELYIGSSSLGDKLINGDGELLFEADKIYTTPVFINEDVYYKFVLNEHYGLFDSEYNIIINPQYKSISISNDLVFGTEDNNTIDIININTSRIIDDTLGYQLMNTDIIYETTTGFGVLNKDLLKLLNPVYMDIQVLNNDRFLVKDESFNYGVVDRNEFTILDFNYETYIEIDGFYIFKETTKEVLVNTNGEIISDEYDNIFPFVEGYAIVKLNNLFGMIDQSGTEVLDTTYYDLTNFKDGYSRTYTSSTINAQAWGVINTDFDVVIPNEYSLIGEVNDTIFSVTKDFNLEFSSGYINIEGNIVLELSYHHTLPFENGFGRVIVDGGKYRIVDVDGNFLTETEYTYVSEFTDGYFIAQKDASLDSNCLLDSNGIEVTDSIFARINPFYDGIASVITTDGANYINIDGEFLLDTYASHTDDFQNGFGIVLNNNSKYDLIDTSGNYILESFDEISIGEDLIKVKHNNKYGYYDFEGNLQIDHIYDYATDFVGGYAFVCLSEVTDCGVIDTDNNPALPLIYVLEHTTEEYIRIHDEYYQYFLRFTEDGFIKEIPNTTFIYLYDGVYHNLITDAVFDYQDISYKSNNEVIIHHLNYIGLSDISSNVIIEPNYYDFTQSVNCYIVRNQMYSGLVDDENHQIIPLMYDFIYHLGDGYFAVVQGDTIGVYDSNGTIRIPTLYEDIQYLHK